MKAMKKLAIVFAILCVFMAGCTPQADGYQSGTDRFKIAIYEENNTVYVDTETGVMYFFHKSGYGGGMSVMVDADGNPLIWEE